MSKPKSKFSWKQAVFQSGMLMVLFLILLYCVIFIPNFASLDNLENLGLQVSIVALISCTMLFCLAGGDFDLSVGSTLAVGGITGALVTNSTGNIWLGLLAALGLGAFIGLVNGFFIAKVGINALIVTLATMLIVRGLTNILGDGMPVTIKPPEFELFSIRLFDQVPIMILYMIAAFLIFGFLLNRTIFGRNTLAIGGNPEAAKLAGINILKTKLMIFVLSGVVAAFAGVVIGSRSYSASNNAGEGMELQAISACVLGGVSLAGGVGSIGGVITGVLIMGTVQIAMQLKNIDTFWQMVVTGGILLFAVTVDKIKIKALNT